MLKSVTSHLRHPFWNKLRSIKYWLSQNIRDLGIDWSVFLVKRITKMRVSSGPFAGMIVSSAHVYGAPVAKLLGTYEKELHPHFHRIIHCGVKTVLDVGCAEGYYAIGLALQKSVTQVSVWESLWAGREITKKLAQLNCVDRKIQINGVCDEATLYDAIADSEDNGFLVMDIEGGEMELLSQRVCDALRCWAFIVELHEFIRPGCGKILSERFDASHLITIVRTQERKKDDYPLKMPLSTSVKLLLMNEGRPGPMAWLIGIPLNSQDLSA